MADKPSPWKPNADGGDDQITGINLDPTSQFSKITLQTPSAATGKNQTELLNSPTRPLSERAAALSSRQKTRDLTSHAASKSPSNNSSPSKMPSKTNLSAKSAVSAPSSVKPPTDPKSTNSSLLNTSKASKPAPSPAITDDFEDIPEEAPSPPDAAQVSDDSREEYLPEDAPHKGHRASRSNNPNHDANPPFPNYTSDYDYPSEPEPAFHAKVDLGSGTGTLGRHNRLPKRKRRPDSPSARKRARPLVRNPAIPLARDPLGLDLADAVLLDQRAEKIPIKDIAPVYQSLSSLPHPPARSTLSNRARLLKASTHIFSDAEDDILLSVKRQLETAWEAKKWDFVRIGVRRVMRARNEGAGLKPKSGVANWDTQTLRRRFHELLPRAAELEEMLQRNVKSQPGVVRRKVLVPEEGEEGGLFEGEGEGEDEEVKGEQDGRDLGGEGEVGGEKGVDGDVDMDGVE